MFNPATNMHKQVASVYVLLMISSIFLLNSCSKHGQAAHLQEESLGVITATSPVQTSMDSKPLQLTHQLAPSIPNAPLLIGISAEDIAMAKAQAQRNFQRSWKAIGLRSRFVRQRLLIALEASRAPLSLQVIPAVESTYNPYALSHAGALGLWQLMPKTAEKLGVHTSKEINGRRNISAATTAAVHYLQSMHQRFNNWPLAIAAYNMGPYAVERRLKKQAWVSADGLENMPIPVSTRAYVQHVIGLAALLHDKTFTFPEPVKTQTLELQTPINIQQLAHLSGMTKDDIFRFNPCLNQAQYLFKTITIHIPSAHMTRMQQNIAQAGVVYRNEKIKKGDNLWDIARKHHTSVRMLKKINKGMGKYLRIGHSIKVPANKLAQANPDHNPLLSNGHRIRYKVRNGDSLWRIANRFGTTPHAIARSNQISMNRVIRAGDVLWVFAKVRPS